ncbi:Ig-like domain-containing protein [Microbacterium sp. P06]|uniref:Ig-like domain-containing protein n=1 Tax=Microbacterium sp. P06 TaxID=3366949 RepID=UPI0037472EE7
MRRRVAAGIAAAGVAVALVVGVSVVWPGLDAQETPEVDTSVWALQTGENRRYARVNTTIGELDTVRSVSNPSHVVQGGDGAYLFSDSYSKLTRIDEALPVDLDEEALRTSPSTPAGTTQVVTSGDFAAYLTDTGAVFAGSLSAGDPAQFDPSESDDADAPQYAADAIAVDRRGQLFAYSSADASVVRYDIPTAEVRGRDPLDADLAAPALTAAGDTWVLVDGESGEVRVRDAEAAISADLTGTIVVGEPDPDGSSVYLADESSLVRVPADGSAPVTEVDRGASVIGTPAPPIVHDGEVYAAWLGPSDGGGLLWSAGGGERALDYGGESVPDQRRPVFVATDEAVILNETRTGWVWTVPDGSLVPSSQDWSLDDRTDPDAVPSEEQLSVVIDPKPPIAEPDAFGVRGGSLVTLPVLMNDHDPNEDVLSIDPASVTGLDPGFGSVSITDDGQRLAVRVEPGATGSAAFSYGVTDGTAQDGLSSAATTVTLTVSTTDAAPEWCGVERCLLPWPEPEVARGGTVTVPVLPGWVDPDGDPLLLLSVTNPSGVGTVAATPAGEVVYQHSDDGSGGEQLIELPVTVADTTGQSSQRSLLVRVSPTPALAVQSFAVVDSIGSGVTVDVAPHVTGTSGALSVSSVRVLDDAAASATVVGGTTTFDFSARDPGTFRVGFTVTDGATEATGTARVTLLPADAPAQLATSPVVAFVHPQEDATLDVFAAVSNPTRRVLLLSDVVASADEGATLSVDAVGQNNLRVSGTTAGGEPGRLGTVAYTVSDGTEDEGARVSGEATVYLLPPAPEIAPIAVDDSIVVRAGSQIDIPVLDNDISPAGGRPTLNPASVVSSTPDALAFASGGVLRYLAPTEPGEYGIDYSVYTTGLPSLSDTATVRVRVLPGDVNRAPLPDTVEGRVLSGQATAIDFDGFGMDPDGDVVTLERIVTQPESGSATISADGESMVYTSVPGYRGQVEFRYRAVDASGEGGEGTVRVGVLDADSNPSPVTFTDYVQVQAGPENTIRVSALANDIDPTQGSLKITDVRPDLPEQLGDGTDNAEYTRLAGQVADVTDTDVLLAAGENPGTMSFLYDVESDSGNTGRGLIVVKVVRESVPDFPVVTDTVLTTENREEFLSGVDVLTAKAAWSGGDVGDLTVGLWGEPGDVAVDGRSLRGDLPSTTRVIPFAVTGEVAGAEVQTYAFLRVPGDDDLALSLRAGTPAQQVNELESVTFEMNQLVALPRGTTLEVGDDLRASGSRAAAACTSEGGTSVRYDSGEGAPWTDACQVPVRIAGTEDWTYLSVPLLVNALDPQPELRAASLTVGPGETATFDLRTMTTWQLRDDWDSIQYSVDYSGGAFDVTLAGSVVTVTGTDRAVPGSENAALIGVTSHTAVAPARLILRVGAAPSTLPQGGSTSQQCSQAAGSSCTVPVVGTSGEVNPLPRTPLEVVDVRPTGACVGVSFRVASANAVIASWTGDAPGATCSASFTVRDAQGRATAGPRDGRLLLDLQGFPKGPGSLRQTAYGDGTVSLRVDAGESRLAYPALTGFVVRYAGQEVARCTVDGACPTIAAPNGEQRVYEAWAVNATGESRVSVRTTAWAYDTPAAPRDVRSAPQPNGSEGNLATLSISGIDAAETGRLVIVSPSGETREVRISLNQDAVEVPSFRVGSNSSTTVTVTPFSRFELPPGLGGQPSGQSKTVQANGIGAPTGVSLNLVAKADGNGEATVVATASAQANGVGSKLLYGIVRAGDRCRPTDDGQSRTFTGLDEGDEYSFTVCVESTSGGRSFGTTEVSGNRIRVESTKTPSGWTFEVDRTPTVDDNRAAWRITSDPQSRDSIPRNYRAQFSRWNGSTTVFDQDPGITVQYVRDGWAPSPSAPVTAREGSAPYQVSAEWRVSSCIGGESLKVTGSISRGGGSVTAQTDSLRIAYYDSQDRLLITTTPGTVPDAAASVRGIPVTASVGQWNLQDAAGVASGTCTPKAVEPPEDDTPPNP